MFDESFTCGVDLPDEVSHARGVIDYDNGVCSDECLKEVWCFGGVWIFFDIGNDGWWYIFDDIFTGFIHDAFDEDADDAEEDDGDDGEETECCGIG